MARRYFPKSFCEYCGKMISYAGYARVSHLRVHVREGLLEERRESHNPRFKNYYFVPTKKGDFVGSRGREAIRDTANLDLYVAGLEAYVRERTQQARKDYDERQAQSVRPDSVP